MKKDRASKKNRIALGFKHIGGFLKRSSRLIFTSVIVIIIAIAIGLTFGLNKTFDFANADYLPGWGVLAFNLDKGTYQANETSFLSVAVLDERGETVCDAGIEAAVMKKGVSEPSVTLSTNYESNDITNFTYKLLSIFGVDKPTNYIIRSPNCEEKETLNNDYSAYLTLKDQGEYEIIVLATNDNGTYEGKTSFTVYAEENQPKFDVSRVALTRVYPPTNYSMSIRVTPQNDYKGIVEESVPKSFDITPEKESTFVEVGDEKRIVWEVDWKAGETYVMNYGFKVPQESPDFYLVGPLRISDYIEPRTWQLAGDAVTANGVMFYGQADSNVGKLIARTFGNPNTYNGEINTNIGTATNIMHVAGKTAPTREEIMFGYVAQNGQLNVIQCTNGCDVAGDYSSMWSHAYVTAAQDCDSAPTVGTCHPGFDLNYEALSGRALVVYAGDGADAGTVPDTDTIYYDFWDGSSWSPNATPGTPGASNALDLPGTGGTPEWVRVIPVGDYLANTRSNQAAVLISDSDDDLYFYYWNGSFFDSGAEIYTTLGNCDYGQCFDGNWQGNNTFLVSYTNSGSNEVRYNRYVVGSGWDGDAQAYTTAAAPQMISTAPSPTSSRLFFGNATQSNDMRSYIWRYDDASDGWTVCAGGCPDANTEGAGGPQMSVAFERFNGEGLLVFNDSANGTTQGNKYVTYAAPSTWGSATATGITPSDDHQSTIIFQNANGPEIMIMAADVDCDMDAVMWTGSGLGTVGSNLETSLSSTNNTCGNSVPIRGMATTGGYGFTWQMYSPWGLNWRFTDDVTTATPGSWIANENTTATGVQASGDAIRLRYNFVNRGVIQQALTAEGRKYLQYTTDDPESLTATWTNVDADDGAGIWRYDNCAAGTDDSAIPSTQLTAPSGGSNTVGDFIEGSGNITMTHSAGPALAVENDYCLETNGATEGSTYYFRAYDNQQITPVWREQDNDGNVDCASTTCAYPSVTIAAAQRTISGTAYTSDSESGTLNSSGGAIKLVNVTDNTTFSDSDGTDGSGAWSISASGMNAGDLVVIYINDAAADGTLIFKYGTQCTGNPNCTGLKLYQNGLILRDENSSTLANSDLANCDDNSGTYCNEAELGFTSDAGTLTVNTARKLVVWTGDQFIPGGTVDVEDMKIDGTYTAGTSQAINVSGNWDNNGTFTASTSTVTFDASDTGNTVEAGTSSFNNVTFAGGDGSGGWTVQTQDMTVAGTLNVDTSDSLIIDTGRTLSHTGATLTLSGSIDNTAGSGTLEYRSTTAFPTSGTMSADLQMYPATGDQTLGARTSPNGYLEDVVIYNNSGVARVVTLGSGASQTIDIGGVLTLNAQSGNFELRGTTNDPVLNVTGALTCNASAATETITAPDTGSVSWTFANSVTLTNCTYTKGSETLVMNTTGTLTSASQTLQNVTLSGTITLAAATHTLAGSLNMTGGTVTTTGSTVVMNGSGTLTSAGNTLNNLTLSGTITLANATHTVGGSLNMTGGTITAGTSTVTMNGSGTYTSGGNTLNNLTLSGTITLANATHAVGGNLDLTGGTVTAGTSTINMTGTSKNITTAGNTLSGFTSSGSITAVGAFAASGNFTISASSSFAQAVNNNVLLTGDTVLINETATFTKASGSGILILDGVSDNQTFEDANTDAKEDLGNVQIGQSPGTTKLKSDMAATSLTIATGDTFETHGWEVDLSGALDCQGNCVLDLQDDAPNNDTGDPTTITFGGNWTMSATGTFIPFTNSTITPDGTADQTIATGGKAFYNFYANNSAALDANDDVIISSAFTIDGALTVNDGELDLDTNDPTTDVAGNVSITSEAELLATSSGTFTPGSNWDNNGTFTHASGTVTFDAADTDNTIESGSSSFNNVTFQGTDGSGTWTVQTDDATVAGTIDVDTSDILIVNTSRTLTHTGSTLTLDGTIDNTAGSGTLEYRSTTSFPTSGTMSADLQMYPATGDQTLGARTSPNGYLEDVIVYNNSGSARVVTLASGTIDIGGVLTLNAQSGNLEFRGTTNDPVLNVTGALTCNVSAATETITAPDTGSVSWTFANSVNLTNCTYTKGTETLIMSTTGTLTSASQTLNNLTLSGTITLANETHTVSGNLSLASGTITAGTSTVSMTGSGKTIIGGGQTLSGLTIDGDGTITLQTSDLTVSGTLNVTASDSLTIDTSRTLTHTDATLTLNGTINGPGRLTYRSTTDFPTSGTLAASLILRMDANGGDQQMGARTDYQLVEIDNSGTTAGRTVTAGTAGSQTLTIASTLELMNTGADPSTTVFQVNTWDPNLTVNGNVTIVTNTTFEASSATTMNFGAGFSKAAGTFNHNSGTVALTTSTAATIVGNTTFNNLSVSGIGAAKTVTFTQSSVTTVSGTWTVAGALGQKVTLQSSSSPTQWTINPTAASVTYVQVSDSNNTGVAFCATYSTDTGDNNTNWSVSGTDTCGIDISGTSDCTTGYTLRVAVNSSLAGSTTCSVNWTITGVTAVTDDIITVFNDAAVNDDETTGVTQYDGTGNITGMVLNKNVLTIGSDDNASLTVAEVGSFDFNNDTDIMHTGNAPVLTVDAEGGYINPTLVIKGSNTLAIGDNETLSSHNVTINTSGVLTSGTLGVFSISGSWDNNGTFTPSTSTVTFSSTGTETVEAGSSSFNNVVFNNGSGTWTVQTDNMTTNDLTLTAATSFTLESGRTMTVGGNYSQAVVAANTTWTGSTLYLNGSGGMYDINTKTHGGDAYATLRIGVSEDIAMWDSSASSYTIDAGACLFSEDHGGTAGRMNIYGTCNSRTNEYWSYASDFDGAGVTRQADVRFAPSATLTVDNGDTLAILGQNAGANRTIITRESTGNYGLTINGTINAQYYDFDYTNANGVNMTATATVTELSDGSFDNIPAGATSSYITVAGITSAKNFFNNVFDDNVDGANTDADYNVNADGSGINWTFFEWSGNKAGELYDNEANNARVAWNSDITLSVSDTIMNLGLINTLIVGSDNHSITVTTNATNGYTCNVIEDGNLRNGGIDINDVIDGTVNANTEEYGISCSGGGCALSGDNAITGSPLTVASSAQPVTAEATTVTYKAAANSVTVGTTFSHLVTFTCSGDF